MYIPQPGIRRCMKCRWLFVSRDHRLIRRCDVCKSNEENYEGRMSLRVHSRSAMDAVTKDPTTS